MSIFFSLLWLKVAFKKGVMNATSKQKHSRNFIYYSIDNKPFKLVILYLQ